MSWVKWLKGKTDGAANATDDTAAPRTGAPPRRSRKGGDAYAKEWVKVLEEASPERDPSSTYTWELQAEGPPQPVSPAAAAPTRKRSASQEPYDTYTWELQEGESPEDPWGLQKKEAEAVEAKKKRDGINPYDTGVFNASWTGRFDQR